MRLFGSRQSVTAEDRLERRFGLRLDKLPGSAREAVAALMAEIDLLSREHAALAEQLAEARALADRDALTPVYNRRAFIEELRRLASYVERYHAQAALLFIDLNDFKRLNDRFGHAVGDAALSHVARQLLRAVRDSDIVGRIGGDEFAVALANVSPEEARRKAETLAELIASAPCEFEGERHWLSASVGAYAFGAGAKAVEAPEALLARADEAMYAVKQASRLKTAAS